MSVTYQTVWYYIVAGKGKVQEISLAGPARALNHPPELRNEEKISSGGYGRATGHKIAYRAVAGASVREVNPIGSTQPPPLACTRGGVVCLFEAF